VCFCHCRASGVSLSCALACCRSGGRADCDHCDWAQELGVSILQDLHRQRQTISHARDSLHGADDNISRARRVLASMSRRITTNKLIMVGIILLLLVAIVIVVYYKFIKK
jgi:hypothetical protein